MNMHLSSEHLSAFAPRPGVQVALSSMSVIDLELTYRALRAQAEAVQSIQNQPRCTERAFDHLEDLQAGIAEQTEAVIEALKARTPATDDEASARLAALLDYAGWLSLSMEEVTEMMALPAH
jgi:hypothetical protein